MKTTEKFQKNDKLDARFLLNFLIKNNSLDKNGNKMEMN
jgi:hypothetical protein